MDSLSYNACSLFSGVQHNPPQGLSTPDSQLRADGSRAANPVSGVVPPECCRLLHLLTLLLTLWGKCSHICLCVWCDNLFHSNNHCGLDECLQRALFYTDIPSLEIKLARLNLFVQCCLLRRELLLRVTKCHIIMFTELQFVFLLTKTFTLKSNMIRLELFSIAKTASAES